MLAAWAGRLAALFAPGDDVFAYFNNDPRGCAVRDAQRFAAEVENAGLTATRVRQEREVVVAPA